MPKKISPEQLTLYYSATCPFCHRVLNALQAMGLSPDLSKSTAGGITLKDTMKNSDFREELITGGGKKTVPCLAIQHDNDIEWMYESLDIIAFLQAHFSDAR